MEREQSITRTDVDTRWEIGLHERLLSLVNNLQGQYSIMISTLKLMLQYENCSGSIDEGSNSCLARSV